MRPFSGQTAPGSAINFAAPLFGTNDFDGATWVIDVSGDGTQNDGSSTSAARDAGLLAGVDRINGLAIGNAALVDWYENNVQGGTDSFTLQAANFSDFSGAVEAKLAFEASGTTPTIPLPATMYLLIAGLGGLGALAMRRKAAKV